jgi:hypothetical protein
MTAKQLNAAVRKLQEQHRKALMAAMERYDRYLEQQTALFERETARAEAEMEKHLEQFTKLLG